MKNVKHAQIVQKKQKSMNIRRKTGEEPGEAPEEPGKNRGRTGEAPEEPGKNRGRTGEAPEEPGKSRGALGGGFFSKTLLEKT